MPTIKEIGVGAVISKNLSTVNAILKELHTDITDVPVLTFEEIEVDVIELQPENGSLITQNLSLSTKTKFTKRLHHRYD